MCESAAGGNKTQVQPSRSRRLFFLAVACTLAAGIIVSAVLVATIRTSLATSGRPSEDASSATAAPLVVGIGRVPGGPREWNAYMAAFAQLEDDLGRAVSVRLLPDEPDAVDAFEDGQVDIALVTLRAYLRLEREGTARLVAAPVIAGQRDNAAMLLVREDSEYRTLDDLRGARVALRPGSLAGEGYAAWLLESREETIGSFFGEIIETESQDASLERVARGEADATFVPRWDLFGWSPGTFRALAESPAFAMPPVIARHDLDEKTLELIRTSLTSEAMRSALPESRALGGFVVVSPDDYAFVRLLAPYRSQQLSADRPAP